MSAGEREITLSVLGVLTKAAGVVQKWEGHNPKLVDHIAAAIRALDA